MDWLRPKRRQRRAVSQILYAGRGRKGLPVGVRLQMLLSRWRTRRAFSELIQERGLPSFYTQAAVSDIEGLVVEGGRGEVGQFVPKGFEACAWLPSPAWKWVVPDTEGAVLIEGGNERSGCWAKPVTWAEVAAASGLDMHKAMRWGDICGPSVEHGQRAASPDQAWTWGPSEGTIEPFVAESLFEVLSRWTQPADRCLSGQWEGGSSDHWRTDARLVTPHWVYFVWACEFGELGEWLAQPDSLERDDGVPHVLWPATREWFLANLYGGRANYVAGSREIVDAVLESGLEAYEVEWSDRGFPAASPQ